MKFIVGIDEVGKGPLAGPVTICIVVCEENLYKKLRRSKNLPPIGKDSKKLSQTDRQKYSKSLEALSRFNLDKFSFRITHISNKVIDRKGISFAISKAISDGIKKLNLKPKNTLVLLDGSLKAPSQFKNQKTIIKGDEKEKIIAWSSILAKVSRDALMVRYSKRFLYYGFELHKGYGTEKHRLAIQKNGLSVFHRKTFCKNLIMSDRV